MTSRDVLRALHGMKDSKKAAFFPRFFKTGKGEYGEGDRFLGITVPQVRSVVKNHGDLPLKEVEVLLKGDHEVRLAGLLILVAQFQRSQDPATRKKIVQFYLKHLDAVNNWDLVDSSAPQILGSWLLTRPLKERVMLTKLAKTRHLWKQRIAIVATQSLIREGQCADTIRISEILLHHQHDLIHKAVGWMLREMGKKDQKVLEQFLKKYAAVMPRTMLRYAIERFPEATRMRFLKMKPMRAREYS